MGDIQELYQQNNMLRKDLDVAEKRIVKMKEATRKVYDVLMKDHFACPICGRIDDCAPECPMPQWVTTFED